MKKMIALMLLFLSAGFIFSAKKVLILPEVLRPEMIEADENQLYITEKANVYIYSLKDFKLRKKFGRDGEGPREFKVQPDFRSRLHINIQADHILVNSLAKISFFTLDGKYKGETRSSITNWHFKPIGKNYVGYSFLRENDLDYFTINLYDSKFKKTSLVVKHKYFYQRSKIFKVDMIRFPLFYIYHDKIFIDEEFSRVSVFDKSGKRLFDIDEGFKKVEITDSHKKKFIEFFKTDPRSRDQYESVKSRMKFASHFPLIRYFHVADKKIYVLTFEKKEGKSKFLIFDIKGNALNTCYLPVVELNPFEILPYTIKGDRFYQFVESEEVEEWELHIHDIK